MFQRWPMSEIACFRQSSIVRLLLTIQVRILAPRTWEATMKFNRVTVILMVALAVGISSRATFASDKTEVVDTVNRYLSNLEKDKIQTARGDVQP